MNQHLSMPVKRDHALIFRQLECILRNPIKLTLEFIDHRRLTPNIALAYWSMLKNKRSDITLITKASSNLVGAEVLIWLLGDRRVMRDRGWILLPDPDEIDQLWKDYGEKNPFGLEWWEMLEPGLDFDYRQVLELISKYFPVYDFLNQRLEVSDLKRLGLLTTTPSNFLSRLEDDVIRDEKFEDEIPF